MWTVVLVGISILGLWLAPRHWYGWAITTLSEFLWYAYAVTLHSTSLKIMSGIWFFLNGRATLVARKAQRGTNTREST